MAILRIPFASKRQRDLAIALLNALDYEQLDLSEPSATKVRPEPGETLPALRDGRRQIVFRGTQLPQWAGAVAASVAWKLGKTQPETPWHQLFLDENLLLVAATTQDVRGTRGLLEVDHRGKILRWRGRSGDHGALLPIQHGEVERLLSLLDEATRPKKRVAKTR